MDKQTLLSKLRGAVKERYDMPDLAAIDPITYDDKLAQFTASAQTAGAKVENIDASADINAKLRQLYPDAKVIASPLPEVTIANLNPDTIPEAADLNGTDLCVVRGEVAVAENGCIWIPQTMKEKAALYISEKLVIIIDAANIVNNMHEAYGRVAVGRYGFGCFISGPSKTADIAQTLVFGAQAARSLTILVKSEE